MSALDDAPHVHADDRATARAWLETSETMKAAVRRRYGPPDVVEVRDVERPIPAGDDVLVRVQAASVNRADLDLIYPKPGFARLFLGLRAPRVHRLGCDVAGVVEAVGPGVTRFQPGDLVYGDMYAFGLGSFAEYTCAPERAFLRIPKAMTVEDAANFFKPVPALARSVRK